MKRSVLYILLAAMAFAACRNSEYNPAHDMLLTIEQLNQQGRYQEALDSIRQLRKLYPQATEERRRALEIWQEASLKKTQQDIAETDSMLTAANEQIAQTTDLRQRNRLTARRDSLEIRYQTLCKTVLAIKAKMEKGDL